MKNWHFIVFFTCVFGLVMVSGCATTSFGNQQAGNFGSTAEQQKAVDWFVSTYGDPRGSGTPAFIEPMVSTSVVDDMPADKVTAFSKDTDKIYFWVFYKHFTAGDTITMNLVYTTNGKTVISSEQKTAGEFGPVTGSVSKPTGGWPVGTYAITFSGKGATSTVNFEVIDGSTTTVPLPYAGTTGIDPTPIGKTSSESGSVNNYGINDEGIKGTGVTPKVTSTTNGVAVQSVNVYVFPDGSAVASISYLPGTMTENSEQEMKIIASGVFGSISGPIYPVTRMAGPFSQSLSNIEDNGKSMAITIPVDYRETISDNSKHINFGIPQFASATINETGTLYSTQKMVFPSKIAFTIRYFDTARAAVLNTDAFPSTTHFVRQLSNGKYMVYPIRLLWFNSAKRYGEPVPGAEVYIELEPDDEPIIVNPDSGDPTLFETIQTPETITPTVITTTTKNAATLSAPQAGVSVPVTTQMITTTKCIPVVGATVIINQIESSGQTQIAQTTTNANGEFSFSLPVSKTATKKVQATTRTVSFIITAAGYTLDDGASNKITKDVMVSEGPSYTFTVCWQQSEDKAQGRGSFAVSGKSST